MAWCDHLWKLQSETISTKEVEMGTGICHTFGVLKTVERLKLCICVFKDPLILLLEMCSIEMHLPKDMRENVSRNPILVVQNWIFLLRNSFWVGIGSLVKTKYLSLEHQLTENCAAHIDLGLAGSINP